MTELIAWLLRQITMDETQANAMPHAIEHLAARWGPAHLLARCDAARKVIALYESAQGEAAVTALSEAVRALTVPYAHLAGYQESWRPAA